jgi:hypothetical protein
MKNNEAISGIFIAEALSEFVRNGYGMSNLWGTVNGYDAATGDMGMLSVKDPSVNDYTPHPSFYTYYLYGKMFGDVMVGISPVSFQSVRAAATTFSSGELSVLLVNPSDTVRTVQLNLGTFQHNGFAYSYVLQANSATTDTVTLNGRKGTNFGPLDYATIPVLRTPAASVPLIRLPPWSVQFVLFKPQATTSFPLLHPGSPAKVESSLRHDLLGRIITE